MNRLAAVLLGLVLMGLASPAAAASFDCAKARTRVEKVICADPELSRQDEALARDYRDALQVWGGEIAAYVKMTQRGWMGGRTLLPVGQDMGGVYCTDDSTRLTCLRGLYADRIAVLRGSGFRLGGVYVRGQDMLRIKPVPTGLDFGFALADSAATQGFTPDGVPTPVAYGQASVLFVLAGSGPDACRLQGAFTAQAVTITQQGPCSGAKLGGRWTRDPARDPDGELF